MGVCISLRWAGRSSNLCGLLVDQCRVDRVVGSGGFFLRLLLFCFFFLASVFSRLRNSLLKVQTYVLNYFFN
jgi:hypothetical protein